MSTRNAALRNRTIGRSLRAVSGIAMAATLAAGGLTMTAPGAQAATSAEVTAANAVLALMNSQRAAHHLPALRMSTALISSARRHDLAMAKANTLSHQLPGEAVFTTRISQAGVKWHSAAENVGWTTDRSATGAKGLQTQMYNEKAPNDGHRRNTLSTAVHYVGIDTYIDARTGKLWLTEDFADVAGSTSAPVAKHASSVANHNPVGFLDSAAALPGHRVRVTGWAVDPDNKQQPLTIVVYADGKPVTRFRTGVARPDVARAKKAGPNQGYSVVLTLRPGVHTIVTYAGNIGTGNSSSRLGSRGSRV